MVNWSIFSVLWFFMAIIFTILALHSILLPPERRIKLLSQLSSFGKTDTTYLSLPGQSLNKLLDYFVNFKVNKGRHFKYFYLFALVNFSLFYFLIFLLDSRTCARFIHLFCSSPISATFVGHELNLDGQYGSKHILLSLMLLVHVIRRFYESTFVAVQNKHESRMHVTHMILGYFFYTNLTLLILHSGVTRETNMSPLLLTSGSLIFALGSYIQYSSHITLAQARQLSRKQKSGEYCLPTGGFFTYVSCPNYLGEIIIYLGFAIVSSFDINFMSLLAFVTALHLQTAYTSHEWYKYHFATSFPSTRRALIPFIF